MTTLLAEERRMERQLYRQSVCSESDSNQESRDSGVELDHKNHDLAWSHSRNDSEVKYLHLVYQLVISNLCKLTFLSAYKNELMKLQTFGNQSTTSEEDEIMRKEREIIETLEQEERIRKQDLGIENIFCACNAENLSPKLIIYKHFYKT
jgi:F-box protein 20